MNKSAEQHRSTRCITRVMSSVHRRQPSCVDEHTETAADAFRARATPTQIKYKRRPRGQHKDVQDSGPPHTLILLVVLTAAVALVWLLISQQPRTPVDVAAPTPSLLRDAHGGGGSEHEHEHEHAVPPPQPSRRSDEVPDNERTCYHLVRRVTYDTWVRERLWHSDTPCIVEDVVRLVASPPVLRAPPPPR